MWFPFENKWLQNISDLYIPLIQKTERKKTVVSTSLRRHHDVASVPTDLHLSCTVSLGTSLFKIVMLTPHDLLTRLLSLAGDLTEKVADTSLHEILSHIISRFSDSWKCREPTHGKTKQTTFQQHKSLARLRIPSIWSVPLLLTLCTAYNASIINVTSGGFDQPMRPSRLILAIVVMHLPHWKLFPALAPSIFLSDNQQSTTFMLFDGKDYIMCLLKIGLFELEKWYYQKWPQGYWCHYLAEERLHNRLE